MISKEPLKTERLKHVTFDGVAPQQTNTSEVRLTVRQNLPVIIRPAGLEKDLAPWKHLTWKVSHDSLTVSNPSPYVVRLGQGVQTLPDNTGWTLPNAYVLPGQTLTVKADGDKTPASPKQVRISPATTGRYAGHTYDATLSQ
ncbi:fimbrial biogenesis chaperone [Pseudomonas yamanorum]